MLPAKYEARVGAAEEARPGSEARNEEVRRCFPQSAGLASVRRKKRDRDRGGRKCAPKRCTAGGAEPAGKPDRGIGSAGNGE